MEIEKVYLEEHRVRLTIKVSAEQMDKAKRRAAKKLARQVRIPGFRPGKAPYNVVVRTVGENAILEEAIDLVLDEVYPQALEEAGVEAYGPGEVVDIPSLDPPVFVVEAPLEPEVELGPYRNIRLPYEKPEITEEEVQQTLNEMREFAATLEPVERPAQEGDLVYITVSSHPAEQDESDEEAIVFPEQKYPLIIPTEEEARQAVEEDFTLPGEPYPAFARELIGMQAGEEKTVEYTYPDTEEYDERLRGKRYIAHVRVDEVKARHIPDLDDDFVKSLEDDFETVEELTDWVRTHLEEDAIARYNNRYRQQVLEEIMKEAVVRFPPEMLEKEVGFLREELELHLEERGLTLEQYLRGRDMDEDALEEELENFARERLTGSLVLNQLALEEEIEVPPEDPLLQQYIQERLQDTLSTMGESEAQQQLRDREWLESAVISALVQRTIELTMERLQAIASGQADAEGEEESAETTEASEEDTETEETPPTEASADNGEAHDEASV